MRELRDLHAEYSVSPQIDHGMKYTVNGAEVQVTRSRPTEADLHLAATMTFSVTLSLYRDLGPLDGPGISHLGLPLGMCSVEVQRTQALAVNAQGCRNRDRMRHGWWSLSDGCCHKDHARSRMINCE